MLVNFREHPGALAGCFGGAVFVQATIVLCYVAVAHALGVNIAAFDLAVIVPISFIVQMLPVSVNGFGVREATFSYYFTRVGLPIESALLVSLVATGAHHALLADRRRRSTSRAAARMKLHRLLKQIDPQIPSVVQSVSSGNSAEARHRRRRHQVTFDGDVRHAAGAQVLDRPRSGKLASAV